VKIVKKPWGEERWIELNDKYCYKQICINSGHRTSLQYHRHKLETNFVISGRATLELEDHNGEMQMINLLAGDHATVRPFQKHRITAATDIVLMEVSTPEVDDVVRIEDDTNRLDGRIDSEHE
jgi:mannose-6-phosphate isomerase